MDDDDNDGGGGSGTVTAEVWSCGGRIGQCEGVVICLRPCNEPLIGNVLEELVGRARCIPLITDNNVDELLLTSTRW